MKERELRKETNLMTIKEIIFEKSRQTNGKIDWKRLSEELSERRLAHRNTFDRSLMSALLLNYGQDEGRVDKELFDSVINFLRSMPNITDNIVATAHFCHFIGHFHLFLNDSDLQLIRQTADQLMSKYLNNRLTQEMLDLCLLGLSKSSKDNCIHAIKLLDQLRQIDSRLLTQIIESSVNFGLIDHSLALLKKKQNLRLSQQLVTKFVVSWNELTTSFEQTIDLLTAFSQSLVIFDSELKPIVRKLVNKFYYESKSTFIEPKGLCLKCDHQLRGVSAEEQTILLKEFCSRLFNRDNDLLMKSFPEYDLELKAFDKFMEKVTRREALDLVIDGLNMAFGTHPTVVEDKNNLRQYTMKYPVHQIDRNLVRTLIDIGVDNYSNLLIVGRKHMKRWEQLNAFLESRRKRISIFYTMNKTQDDCYLLYAALHNPKTVVLSNDFYRDFSDKMSKSGNLFERWLRTHKAVLLHQDFKRIEFPDQFDRTVHISRDKCVLHLPFTSENSEKIQWLCCVRQ